MKGITIVLKPRLTRHESLLELSKLAVNFHMSSVFYHASIDRVVRIFMLLALTLLHIDVCSPSTIRPLRRLKQNMAKSSLRPGRDSSNTPAPPVHLHTTHTSLQRRHLPALLPDQTTTTTTTPSPTRL